MDKEHDSSILTKCIEVKGMKGLSLAYIQRFFGHVGVVQEVKRIQDLIIVRFKNQNSVNKALRYNGRVIDKQPIKIRSATTYTTMQQLPHKKIAVNNNSSNFYNQLDKRIKDQMFDLPFLWANILKIINKLQNDKLMWLLHEIFFIKLSQIIHFHAFGTNPRSHYSQITIKDSFLYDTKNNVHLIQSQGSIEKLEILAIPSNQLLDQPNFQCFLASVDTRLKLKFHQLFKFTQGQRLYQLYSLFNTYSLYIPTGQSIFSSQPTLLSSNYSFSVSKQLVTQRRARISLQDTQQTIKRRSQYREIDNKHPNKQIKIFNDSCLNQNTLQKTTYDIFRDDFDGSLTNSCAADIFFAYRMHFVSNFLVVRIKQLGKLNYYRLCFQLRIMHCQGQIISAHDCTQYMFWNRNGEFQQIVQLKILKHNLVISDFEQTQRIVYSLQNYLRFFLPQVSFKQSTKQNQQPILSLIIILQNPTQQSLQKLTHLTTQLSKNTNLQQSVIKIYAIKLISQQKFQKLKCHNFIQEYIDKQKGTFNYQIAKFHAKQIITENPSKFKHIEGVQEYITEVLWKLGQDRNKREVQNRVRVQLHNVRMA